MLLRKLGAAAATVLLLPACTPIPWAKKKFNQGIKLQSVDPIVEDYIRSETIYDQVETLGTFDAIWLSDEIRRIASRMTSKEKGTNKANAKLHLQRQLTENRDHIYFYVLSTKKNPLEGTNIKWNCIMRVDGKQEFAPTEISSVELPHIYQSFFDRRYSRFKEAYRIRFPATDVNNRRILDKADKLELLFNSPTKQAVLTWDL